MDQDDISFDIEIPEEHNNPDENPEKILKRSASDDLHRDSKSTKIIKHEIKDYENQPQNEKNTTDDQTTDLAYQQNNVVNFDDFLTSLCNDESEIPPPINLGNHDNLDKFYIRVVSSPDEFTIEEISQFCNTINTTTSDAITTENRSDVTKVQNENGETEHVVSGRETVNDFVELDYGMEFENQNLDRVLSFKGRVSCVSKNIFRFTQLKVFKNLLVNNEDTSKSIRIRFLIPHKSLGGIIGQRGSNISSIREKSGTSIYTSDEVLPGSSERLMEVFGNHTGIKKAVEMVSMKILDEWDIYTSAELYKPNPSIPSTFNIQTQGKRREPPHEKSHMGFNRRRQGHQSGNDQRHGYNYERRQYEHNYKYSNQDYGFKSQLPSYGGYGSEDMRHGYDSYGDVKYGQYGSSSRYQGPGYSNQGNIGGGDPRDEKGGMYMNSGYSMSPGNNGFQYYMPGYNMNRIPLRPEPSVMGTSPLILPQVLAGQNSSGQQLTTQRMFVDVNKIGAIIGRKGESISSIRGLTGASVEIEKPNPGQRQRLVTITGTGEQVNKATQIIKQKVSI
ncbi:hypothetical protein BB559_003314 [Furculomyces boomerangus]|uniref:K Homology domain-containing protein n=2 Tax=Harpellales TaxID=61421 RepID=A0A2T9YM25_9FUNG|nr:hypothetical protein BB559_007244 [Furculomyces boomerangus]PVU93387.1 hypothetical protein BB559_003314 [Furculomyces boomerangus]PWA02705.1 hypothetical protein BB558_001155 [Smittium angustum]